MKATLPLGWNLLAVPFAAAGAVIVLLFVWAFLAVGGFEHIDRALEAPSGLAPLPGGVPRHRAAIAWPHSRPALMPGPPELSAEERLAGSANLLDFVEGIRHHPVPGGHYLALKAYDFCTREARQTLDALGGMNNVNDVSVETGPVIVADGRQLDAQARLAQLCGTFRNRQLLALDYYLIAEEGLNAQDPRLVMARRMERLSAQWDTTSRDDSTARQALISDVLNSGNGALVRDLASELEVILHSGQLMIGGRAVAPAENADVIDALRLIACEQGAPCTRENEWQQVLACASAGECSPAPWITEVNAFRWRNQIREALLSGPTGIDVIPAAEQRY